MKVYAVCWNEGELVVEPGFLAQRLTGRWMQ